MTEKRFVYVKPVVAFAKSGIIDNLKRNTFDFTEDNVIDSLNELNDENQLLKEENNEIKQLIHTMLVQIDVEKINTENTRYSARIIFTFEEFKKIQQIWKGDV